MTDGGYTTYGGSGWMDQLQQLMSMLAQMNLMAGTAAGQVPAPKTEYTTDEALHAIWDHEKAIRDQYEEAWGDPDENKWDLAGRDVGLVSHYCRPAFGPVAYAKNAGYLEPIEVAETLESKRDKFEQGLATRQTDLAEREQDFIEKMGIERMRWERIRAEAEDRLRREEFSTQADIERSRDAHAYELGIRRADLDELMGMAQIDLENQQLEFDRYMFDSDVELRERQQALAEDVSLSEQERADKYYQLEYALGMGENERANQRLEFEQSTWAQEFGFQKEVFAEESQQAWANIGLGGRELDIMRELGLLGHEAEMRGLGIQERLGLQGLGLEERLGGMDILSGLRGPQDWMAYNFAQRGLQPQQGATPPWWNAAVGGQQLPTYGYMGQGAGPPTYMPEPGAAGQVPLQPGTLPGTQTTGPYASVPGGTPGGVTPPDPYGYREIYMRPGGFPAPSAGGGAGYVPPIVPWQVSPQSWMNMQPSERSQFQGYVESPTWMGGMGGYWPDFQQQMYGSWPTGTAQGVSFFG